ncbi:MAG: squalene/phytoene synthase family protein [Anaerolineae bacterium]|nr:squalene/phytoene synthase family protein [Anaerolineae bacterium]MDW8098435.1 squalene/phytoene synthase family protein [Anaerolineae bacterium]
MTTTSLQHWEHRLLAKALAGLEVSTPRQSYTLEQAYRHCEQITRAHSRTFFLATALMPRGKRQAIRALYAFCRVSDEAADQAVDPRSALATWQAQMADPEAIAQDPVLLAWDDTRRRFRIPDLYVQHLLEGIAQDLTTTRYQTFDELTYYCYGVASTVGLMSMHIIGYNGSEAVPYAIKLGVALQLTNILRDVGEDWQRGRLYLPLHELAAYNLTEEDIAAGRVDERWHAFMRFQIARARRLYAESLPGIAMLHPHGRFAVAAAAELYRGILDDIEAHNYDVFNRRAHVSDGAKLARLPGIWWRVKTNRYR